MKNFLRIATEVDVLPLLYAIHRQPDLWREDTYLRDYPQGPFGEIDSIILRFPPRTVCETEEELTKALVTIDQHENVDQPVYARLPEARPIVFGLMARIQGERLGRVIINRVRPGGRIFPHADTPDHAEYWDRHHVVLQTNPGAVLRCEDEIAHMGVGEVWHFRNELEHEVRNDGNCDRIHMIVDIRTRQPWL